MKTKKSNFIEAKSHHKLNSAQVIKMLRELKGWTQSELAKRSKITASNLSLLENDKVDLGKKRALQLANAFNVHPAIIMFPEYEMKIAA
jgi:transcriptional regulator with XRE-family HTH domain